MGYKPLLFGTLACAFRKNQNFMNTFRLALRPILIAMTCVSIAACADAPTQRDSIDYRSPPPSSSIGTNSKPGSLNGNLTIQSGEGEKLNLPWFIQDAQDWVNSN